MKRRIGITILAVTLLLVLGGGSGMAADKFDLLMRKLVERGVLSPGDAEEIEKEIDSETGQQKKEASQKIATEDAMVQTDEGYVKVPKWVQNLELKGDLRFRYQHEDRDGNDRDERNRGRYRFRLGVESPVTDEIRVGFGLASGSDDPRSTNETLDDTFSTKDIRLDYAFAQYKPDALPWASLIGGKFKNPIWTPKDLLWDGDIRPEGAAAVFDFSLAENTSLFVTPGFFILDEYSDSNADPFMTVLQVGGKSKFGDMFDVKFAGTYYYFDNLQGNSFDQGSGSNTTREKNGEDVLAFGYSALALGGQVGMTLPLDIIPYAALFGEYVQNVDSEDSNGDLDNDDDYGWLLGFKFGSKKIGDLGTWQAKYNYRRLERDAWPDFLPDSDFYGGETNAKGHEVELAFGLTKNVSLAFDYYHTELIKDNGGDEEQEDVFQADLNFKF